MDSIVLVCKSFASSAQFCGEIRDAAHLFQRHHSSLYGTCEVDAFACQSDFSLQEYAPRHQRSSRSRPCVFEVRTRRHRPCCVSHVSHEPRHQSAPMHALGEQGSVETLHVVVCVPVFSSVPKARDLCAKEHPNRLQKRQLLGMVCASRIGKEGFQGQATRGGVGIGLLLHVAEVGGRLGLAGAQRGGQGARSGDERRCFLPSFWSVRRRWRRRAPRCERTQQKRTCSGQIRSGRRSEAILRAQGPRSRRQEAPMRVHRHGDRSTSKPTFSPFPSGQQG
eukprot:scaffold1215_cov363-Pavlova_lutheri.AAC.1